MTQEEEEAQLHTQLKVCSQSAEAHCAEVGFPWEGMDVAELWAVQVGFALGSLTVAAAAAAAAAPDCAKAAQLVARG